jgi:HEPN domain-containing protein
MEEQRWLRQAFLYSKGLRAILPHFIRDLVLDCSKYESDFGNLVSQGKVLDTYYIPTRYPNGLEGTGIPSEYYSQEDAGQCINYAEPEFEEIKDRVFFKEVLATAKEL